MFDKSFENKTKNPEINKCAANACVYLLWNRISSFSSISISKNKPLMQRRGVNFQV